jgi:hypothetical protein
VRGVEHVFEVIDENLDRANSWEFVVRVPNQRTQYIEVRPTRTPHRAGLKALKRRTLEFRRGSTPGYRGKVYCPAALSPLTPGKTKRTARRGERDDLPYWFDQMRHRMRLKPTVRGTRGTDSRLQMVVVRPDDYTFMIKTFLATKAWTILTKKGLPSALAR